MFTIKNAVKGVKFAFLFEFSALPRAIDVLLGAVVSEALALIVGENLDDKATEAAQETFMRLTNEYLQVYLAKHRRSSVNQKAISWALHMASLKAEKMGLDMALIDATATAALDGKLQVVNL